MIRSPRAYRLLLLVLALALALSCAASLGFGAAPVPLAQVLEILGQRLFGLQPEQVVSSAQDSIVWLIRAPRVVLGALVGAGLALVGTALQAVTRNPLADPHLLGVSSGAALGAVVVGGGGVVLGGRGWGVFLPPRPPGGWVFLGGGGWVWWGCWRLPVAAAG